MQERPHDLPYVPHRVEIDPATETLEMLPYGLYIIGSRGSDNINGMMADWVMQVSFQPRLVACSLELKSTTLRNLRETNVFSVNLLESEDVELARRFAQPREASKIAGRSGGSAPVVHDKLRDVPYQAGEQTGCPVLDDALAYLECEVAQFVEAGDHILALGKVVAATVLREGEPMSSRALGWSYAG